MDALTIRLFQEHLILERAIRMASKAALRARVLMLEEDLTRTRANWLEAQDLCREWIDHYEEERALANAYQEKCYKLGGQNRVLAMIARRAKSPPIEYRLWLTVEAYFETGGKAGKEFESVVFDLAWKLLG
jgi:hypothetical protein